MRKSEAPSFDILQRIKKNLVADIKISGFFSCRLSYSTRILANPNVHGRNKHAYFYENFIVFLFNT